MKTSTRLHTRARGAFIPAYQQLISELADLPVGTAIEPTREQIAVVMRQYDDISWDGLTSDIDLVELAQALEKSVDAYNAAVSVLTLKSFARIAKLCIEADLDKERESRALDEDQPAQFRHYSGLAFQGEI